MESTLLPKEYEASLDSLRVTIFDILEQLKNYTDNTCVLFPTPEPRYGAGQLSIELSDTFNRMADIRFLHGKEVIQTDFIDNDYADDTNGYFITVINRYNLEKLFRQIDPEAAKAPLDNLVYYNQKTGKGTVNGKLIHLKKRNKKVFDVLTSSPNQFVERDVIQKLAGIKNKKDKQMYGFTLSFHEFITNIKKACGVNKDVIEVNDGVILKAKVILTNGRTVLPKK